MFSDTHFHFIKASKMSGIPMENILAELSNRRVKFAQDIGTECDDLMERQSSALIALERLSSIDKKQNAERALYFSAGIWPDSSAIQRRFDQVAELKKQIISALSSAVPFRQKISAVGECGIDRKQNSSETAAEERELFSMQLLLAHDLSLPVIVHSRNGFEDTFESIKEAGYDNGVIHCFSYGLAEAKAFLERGWYISFSGAVTYTKKSKMEDIKSLLSYIPSDRILLETDAPFLAPVPKRGTPNLPYYIEYTYNFVSRARNVQIETLSAQVEENSRRLFTAKADKQHST